MRGGQRSSPSLLPDVQGCLAVEGAPEPLLSSFFHFVAAQTYHAALDEAEAAAHSVGDLHSASDCAACGISEAARSALSQALQLNVHHQSPILELPPHALRAVHAALAALAAWALSEEPPQLAGFRLYPPLPGSHCDVTSVTYMAEVWSTVWTPQPLLHACLVAAAAAAAVNQGNRNLAASLLCQVSAHVQPCADVQPTAHDVAHRLQTESYMNSGTPPAYTYRALAWPLLR